MLQCTHRAQPPRHNVQWRRLEMHMEGQREITIRDRMSWVDVADDDLPLLQHQLKEIFIKDEGN